MSDSERQRRKGERFRRLHEGAPFLIPNPWDPGSARVLEGLGFAALATTSWGLAYSLGRRDGELELSDVVGHVMALDQASELPISVDLENGYGAAPADAATAITAAAAAGAVGGSIEDFDPAGSIYPLSQASERVAAAVGAARSLPYPFVLTARAENHFRGHTDLEDTIGRLQAFERAGADVLYAPGLLEATQIAAVCAEVSRPLNVLAPPNLTLDEIISAGAMRISLGGGLAAVAAAALESAALQIRDQGDLSMLATKAPTLPGR